MFIDSIAGAPINPCPGALWTLGGYSSALTRIVSKGQRRIGLEQFVSGLEMIAQKKGTELSSSNLKIRGSTGSRAQENYVFVHFLFLLVFNALNSFMLFQVFSI